VQKTKPKPSRLKDYFITGVFALLPLAISVALGVWILGVLWQNFFSAFVPGVEALLRASLPPEAVAKLEAWRVHQAIGLALLLAFIAAVGFVARNIIGKSLLTLLDKVVAAIPGLNFIYGTIRQFTSTMDPESPQRDAFRHAVLVKVGSARMLGFLTSRSKVKGQALATVFVPCNQLIQGYNLLVPEKDVVHLDMNVDEAFKYIISFGMMAPQAFQARGPQPKK
jgi:uncharacterized membrane protein